MKIESGFIIRFFSIKYLNNNTLRTVFFIIRTACLALGLSFQVSAQSESAPEPEIIQFWEDAPVYISAGANLSQYSGDAFPVRFGYKFFWEAGFLFQYSFRQTVPFYSGIEFLRRGYDINSVKKGTDQLGRQTETRIEGKTDLAYFQFPFLLQLPAGKPARKFHFLAGPVLALRIYYHEKFSGTFSIPSDTVTIPISYEKTGNDALDFLDFSLAVGAKYRINHRWEIWATGSRKLFGISISKENFLTAEEVNTAFALKVLYRFGRMEDIPFF